MHDRFAASHILHHGWEGLVRVVGVDEWISVLVLMVSFRVFL